MKHLLAHLRQIGAAPVSESPYTRALGGVALFVLSIVFVIGGLELGVGSARRLGTGAFPVITGVVLAVLSLTIIAADLQDTTETERPDWMSFVAIGAALAVFALTVGRIGLVPGVFLTTVTASLPDPSLRLPGKMVLGAIVALGCWGLFIGVIGLPIAAFGGL